MKTELPIDANFLGGFFVLTRTIVGTAVEKANSQYISQGHKVK